MSGFIKTTLAKLAAIGAVKRKGIGGLKAYGGEIRGKGHVVHKTGERAGTRTDFVIDGQPAEK